MKHIGYIILIILFTETTAQQLTALDSKETTYAKGRKIKKGDKINLSKKIKINNDGHLGLEYGRWTFYLKPGIYDMDSVLKGQILTREFIVDDSIYSVLKNKNILHCKKAGIQCLDVNQFSNPNYKRKDNTITATGDTVILKWDDRPDYSGFYYVVFSTMFNEFIHLEATNKRELEFNLIPFKSEKVIMYKIISNDCIESDLMMIRVE